MCVMFVQEAGATVSPELLIGMRHLGTTGNKDGMGVMWVDHGRIQIEKYLAKSDQEVVDLYERHRHRACAVHQRNQTLGKVDEDNVHPFKVTSIDDGDPWDIYMMHNGTIRDIQVENGKSDSYNFATYFLRDWFHDDPQAVRSAHFTRIIGALIGNSKLILLSASGDPNDTGCFTVVNSGKGTFLKPGIWISRQEKILPRTASGPPTSRAPIGFKPPEAKSSPLVQPTLPVVGTPTTTKLTPQQTGNWVMRPDGLKTFRVDDPPPIIDVPVIEVAAIELPPPDIVVEDSSPDIIEDADVTLDLAVLGHMSEKQIEAVVEESPGLIASLLHALSRAF